VKKINTILSSFLSNRNRRVDDRLVPPERGSLQQTPRLKEKIGNPLLEKL
jgi:hypothetical protein